MLGPLTLKFHSGLWQGEKQKDLIPLLRVFRARFAISFVLHRGARLLLVWFCSSLQPDAFRPILPANPLEACGQYGNKRAHQ